MEADSIAVQVSEYFQWIPLNAVAMLVRTSFLFGCSGDYAVPLPNAHRLVRANEHEIYIADNHFLVVYGNVVSYAIDGDWVIGELVSPDWPSLDDYQQDAAPTGYFIFNTKTDKLDAGLTQDQFMSGIAKHGLKAPTLKEPDCQRNVFAFCAS